MSGTGSESVDSGAELGAELGDSGNNRVELYTEPERVARERGWRPKEEFQGNEVDFVEAEEFVKRAPLFDKIRSQNKRVKELEKTVEAISKHYSATVAQAKEQAVRELFRERDEAIALGEVKRVKELDGRINQVHQMPEPVQAKPSVPEPIESFLEENKSWFNKDKEMTDFASTFNEAYLKNNPGKLEESLKETLKMVKKAYPEKFTNQHREVGSNVDNPSTGGSTGSGRYTTSRLSSEQKLVYNQLVKTHKQMTHEQYFKSLDDAGYLG